MSLRDWLIELGLSAEKIAATDGTAAPSLRAPIRACELESRILYSASPLAMLLPDAAGDEGTHHAIADLDPSQQLFPDAGNSDADSESSWNVSSETWETLLADSVSLEHDDAFLRQELLFLDLGTTDYQELVDDLILPGDTDTNIEVVMLDQASDGIQQISEVLSKYKNLDAIHIVSHGSDGRIQLGNTWLDSGRLQSSSEQIANWGDALTDDADILVYGCNLASSSGGQTLVGSISELTGADVAASVDMTGNERLGGDWTLEYASGLIEAEVAMSQFVQASWMTLLDASPAGSETLVNNASQDATDADVAMDANGNFVVVWASDIGGALGSGIYLQHFDAAGNPEGTQIVVNTSLLDDQLAPAVAMDADGDFVVVWEGEGLGDDDGIFMQRFDSAGVAQGSETLVNTITTDKQQEADVAMDANGNFVVVWSSDTGGMGADSEIYLQRFNADGTTRGSQTLVNTTVSNKHEAPAVAMDADGDFVVVWEGEGPGDDDGIFLQRFDKSGVVEGIETQVNTTVDDKDISPDVAMDASGNFVVVWEKDSGGMSGNSEIYLQRFDASGIQQNGETIVNSTVMDNQESPSVAMNSSGSFVVVWEGRGTDDSDGVFGQEFDWTGSTVNTEFLVNSTEAGRQSMAAIAMNSVGDFVVAWEGNGIGDDDGVFAQRFEYTADIYYLDGVGDQSDVPSAVLKTDAPTDPSLDNFDPGRDGEAGLLISRGGIDLDESDPAKQQTWIISAAGVVLDGPASLRLWTAVKDFDVTKTGSVTAYLVDSNATASSLTEIASATITRADWDGSDSGTWIEDVFNFGDVNHTLAPDRYLGVKLIVDGAAGDDMWIAYDATAYQSRLQVSESDNIAPIDLEFTSYTIDENIDTTGGLSVGTLSTSDLNLGETFSYSVRPGGDGAKFTIGGANGDELIIDDGVLDFETQSSYAVNIRVTDSAMNTYDETLTINVNDLNESPTDISPNAINLINGTDTTGGTHLATLVTTDPDTGDSFTYSVQPGADGALFTIGGVNGDELIFDDGVLNQATRNSYTVNLRVTDSGLNTYDEAFTVNVTSFNVSPTDIAPDSLEIDENSDTTGGISLGQLSTTDPDSGESFAYSILPGGDGSLFAIGGAASDELIFDDGLLDFETRSTYSVNVRVTDSAMNTYDETLTVNVNDLNETPTAISPGSFVIDENTDTSAGHSLGTLIATDQDSPESFTYTIQGGVDAGLFSIGGVASDQLILTAGTLDFEAQSSYSVVVRVTDSGGNTYDEAIQVNVGDITETPTIAPAPKIPPIIEPPTGEEPTQTDDDTNEPDNDAIIDIARNPDSPTPVPTPTADRIEAKPTGSEFVLKAGLEFRDTQPDSQAFLPVFAVGSTSRVGRSVESVSHSLSLAAPMPVTLAMVSLNTFDSLRDEVANDNLVSQAIVGSTLFATTSLSVGYVLWLIRGGVLLSSVLSSMPAWRTLDPLPVLGYLEEDDDETKDDSLENLVAKSNSKHAESEETEVVKA